VHNVFLYCDVDAVLVAEPVRGERLIEYLEDEIAFFMGTGSTFAVVLHPLDGSVAEETHEIDVQNP
jgi:hypothetical protein